MKASLTISDFLVIATNLIMFYSARYPIVCSAVCCLWSSCINNHYSTSYTVVQRENQNQCVTLLFNLIAYYELFLCTMLYSPTFHNAAWIRRLNPQVDFLNVRMFANYCNPDPSVPIKNIQYTQWSSLSGTPNHLSTANSNSCTRGSSDRRPSYCSYLHQKMKNKRLSPHHRARAKAETRIMLCKFSTMDGKCIDHLVSSSGDSRI